MIDFKLIYKKINKKLSKSEEQVFQAWFNESSSHREYYYKVKTQLEEEKSLTPKKIKKTYFSLKWSAAIFIVFLSASTYVFFSSNTISEPALVDKIQFEDPITPFKAKATLVLANGRSVEIDNKSKFKHEDVEVIEDKILYTQDTSPIASEIRFNTLFVPKGGFFELILSDNTKVWVNSDSQLRYPVKFIDNQPRTVELINGEAYFEVSPSSENNGNRFVVEVNKQQIEVLGTHFNVKAYADDDRHVTSLLEGSVKLTYLGAEHFLKPNQRAIIFKNTGIISVESAAVDEDVLWKSGVFAFSDYTLEDISNVLMRWYDVEIDFARNDLKQKKFNGVLRKNQNLGQILNILSKSISLKYSRNGNRIEIY